MAAAATTSIDPTSPGYIPTARRVAVTGRNGMVSSAHPLASAAGLRVLLDGGNAVDAIVATASALNIVEPQMSCALGVGQMLVYQASSRQATALDFGGRAPAAASPALYPGLDAIPTDDIRTPLVPANLGGWLAALERWGSMDRARVFRDTISYAADGFPLTEGNAFWLADNRERLGRTPDGQRTFVDGLDARTGAMFRQPQAAETYRRFAAEGAAALYGGEVGREVVRAVQEQGGVLTLDDLRRLQPRFTDPIRGRFRAFDVLTMPPPSMGLQILLTLQIMERVDGRALGHNSAAYLHHLAEAINLASVDRAAYSSRLDAPLESLLSATYADHRSSLIRPDRAMPSPGERFVGDAALVPGKAGDPGFTTFLCAADRDGNAVSLTQSLGHAFGCAYVAGETGLLLNDFSWWFDLNPASPDLIAPDKPVEQCLSPTMSFLDDELVLALGTPGGHGIPQTTSQMLLNALEFGMNVQQAIEAPRIRTFTDTWLDAEGRIPADTVAELERLGHRVNRLPDYHWGVGGGHGIQRIPDSGAYLGGADPRRDGYAMGW